MSYRKSLGIDPGLRVGGAGFSVDGVLQDVELVRCETEALPGWAGPDWPAVLATSAGLSAFVERHRDADVAVFEWPQIYPDKDGEERQEDPNDLLPLTAVLHGPIETARRLGIHVAIVYPRLWTKGTPKKIRHKRFLAEAADGGKLTPAERALITKIKPAHLRHNAVDGAQLAKWGHDNGASYVHRR